MYSQDTSEAVREQEILLNSDCDFEFIPVSSINHLKSRKYLYTLL